jgi:glycosyltransferase involved in cell wall biosynthesis
MSFEPARRKGPPARAGQPLRIAQVAPLHESVPPALYGGTERIVAYLCDGLTRRGHDVTLFASGDSRTPARLVAPIDRALRLDPEPRDAVPAHVLEVAQVFARAREFHVIHSHVDVMGFPFSRFTDTPTVHTMHGRLDDPWMRPVYAHFRDVPLVSISDAQRAPLRDLGMRWLGTVPHGLPVQEFPFSPRGGRYLAFLGRMSREKRPDLAIAIAKRVGLPLKMAAKVDPADREYFETEIRPLLDHPLVEYVGEVDEAERARFLGGALGLLFPIDWPEPFGLVMIEALACGTPVVARPCGSVREVVVPGRTGFIAEDVEDLADAVRRLDHLDRRECRRDVEARFSTERMVADYEALYMRAQRAARTA